MSYQPKKPFFTMSIEELKEYVNHCKNIDLKKKRKLKQKAGRKTRSKRLRKTRKKRRKYSRRKKKT